MSLADGWIVYRMREELHAFCTFLSLSDDFSCDGCFLVEFAEKGAEGSSRATCQFLDFDDYSDEDIRNIYTAFKNNPDYVKIAIKSASSR